MSEVFGHSSISSIKVQLDNFDLLKYKLITEGEKPYCFLKGTEQKHDKNLC